MHRIKQMKIAIIGSREGFTEEQINEVMFPLFAYQNNELITGGARGVDSIAIKIAKENNIKIEIIRPINSANKLDYLYRNIEIITKADKIIAFWDGKSRGTKFVIDYAKARNKDIEIHRK